MSSEANRYDSANGMQDIRMAQLESESKDWEAKYNNMEQKFVEITQELERTRKIQADDARIAKTKISEARRLQKAAEAETEGLQHVMKANTIIQEDNDRTQGEIIELLGKVKEKTIEKKLMEEEIVIYRAQIEALETDAYTKSTAIKQDKKQIVDLKEELRIAKLTIEGLSQPMAITAEKSTVPTATAEVPLLTMMKAHADSHSRSPHGPALIESQDGLRAADNTIAADIVRSPGESTHVRAASSGLQEAVAMTHLSQLTPVAIQSAPANFMAHCKGTDEPEQSTEVSLQDSLNVKLTINIDPKDKKNWNLLQRVRAAVSKTSELEIRGPEVWKNALLGSIRRAEKEDIEKAKSIAHWQDISRRTAEEVNSLHAQLNSRAPCVVPDHERLEAEGKAKDEQLRIALAENSTWRQKMGRICTFLDEANAEMRQRDVAKQNDMAGFQIMRR